MKKPGKKKSTLHEHPFSEEQSLLRQELADWHRGIDWKRGLRATLQDALKKDQKPSFKLTQKAAAAVILYREKAGEKFFSEQTKRREDIYKELADQLNVGANKFEQTYNLLHKDPEELKRAVIKYRDSIMAALADYPRATKMLIEEHPF